MKFAKISYLEEFYPDEPINEDFIVEYTDDFEKKLEELDRFEEILNLYDCDGDDAELTDEEFELISTHYEGSKISAISSYVCSLFNVIIFEREEERYW